MKTYVLKDANSSPSGKDSFLNGLVFGFDAGVIGNYAATLNFLSRRSSAKTDQPSTMNQQ